MSRGYERKVALLAAKYGYNFGFGGKHISLTAEDKPRIIASISPRNEHHALELIERDLKKGSRTWKS